MKFRAGLLSLIFISMFVQACADGNALEWMTDKNTSDARQDKIDFAFIEGNCAYVIQMLAPHEGYLSGTELYQYNNALLACSGFSLVNSLGVILDKNGGSSDPFEIIQSLMGTDNLTSSKISELQASYGKILGSCTGSLDAGMKTVCGMAAAADTVLAVSDVALRLSGAESLNATKEGITQAIGGKTAQEIQEAVDASLNDGALSLDRLNSDLNSVMDASSAIADMAESSVDFSEDLDKLANDIKDQASGVITSSSLSDYIYSQFAGGGGSL